MRPSRPADRGIQPAAGEIWPVKTHLLLIYAKFGVGDRAAAAAEAFSRRLLTSVTPQR